MGLIDSEGEVDKENFRPDDIITRAEFTSMLVKALSLREQIISVSGDNELKPTEGVKRSSAAVILNKMLNKLYQ